MTNKDLPAKRDGDWLDEILDEFKWQVQTERGYALITEKKQAEAKSAILTHFQHQADELDRYKVLAVHLSEESTARERAALQATVCHKHGWNTSCPDIAERLKSNQGGETDA